jgi:hypothetical protein
VLSTLVHGAEGGELLALLLLVLRHGGHRPLDALTRLLHHLHHCFFSSNSLITRRYLQQQAIIFKIQIVKGLF